MTQASQKGTGAGLVVRPMELADLDFALELAAKEGWNPGPHDAPSLYACDASGFLVGELDGERVGCISAVRYDSRFSFIGLFIVAPDHRGRGYGARLWGAAMNLLGDRVVGLDAVLAQEARYRRSGFRAAYSTIRFAGVGGVDTTGGSDAPRVSAGPARRYEIRSLGEVPREDLYRYDRACFPAQRRAFLDMWTAMPRSTALCALHDGALCGYGVARACLSGHKIGPLFADGPEAAEALYRTLCATVPGGEVVFLDIPEVNGAGLGLAASCGLSEVFRTVRMYRGPRPAVALERVFGVTTFELG
jgi:GNAT superfamily N-acetyltransferase